MTFGKNIQNTLRIEFLCFSFHVGLLFVNFSSVKRDTKITQMLKITHGTDRLHCQVGAFLRHRVPLYNI